MELKVDHLSFHYPQGLSLKDIQLVVSHNQFVGIVGPNGSGKSTLLKNIYRALKPESGDVLLNNQSIQRMSYKQSAKSIAVVTQENEIEADFSVEQIVMMGRTPHKGLLELDNERDYQIVKESLEKVGLKDYGHRRFNELSGGEKQRVRLARALAQQPEILILDEPTNHLDIYYQLQLFEIITQQKITVVSVIHDLNFACMYCDYLYVMDNGMIYTHGLVEEVMTSSLIQDVFHVSSIVEKRKEGIHIIYLPKGKE